MKIFENLKTKKIVVLVISAISVIVLTCIIANRNSSTNEETYQTETPTAISTQKIASTTSTALTTPTTPTTENLGAHIEEAVDEVESQIEGRIDYIDNSVKTSNKGKTEKEEESETSLVEKQSKVMTPTEPNTPEEKITYLSPTPQEESDFEVSTEITTETETQKIQEDVLNLF